MSNTAVPVVVPAADVQPEVDVSEQKSPGFIARMPEAESRRVHERRYAYYTWVPSQGHLYGRDRFPGGEVILSPMTTSEERILTQAKRDRMEILDTIIKRCLVHCPVHYDDLLMPDMFYLLLVIRNITYGAHYQFHVTCPACDTEFTQVLEIPKDLKLRVLQKDDGEEPWEVKLPVSGDTLSFRLLRVKDEADVRSWSRNQYQRSQQVGDPGYTYRLAKHIVRINGNELDPVQRLSYAESMIGADSVTFRDALAKQDFGATLNLEYECQRCGRGSEMQMPFDKEFFRPSNISSS